MKAKLMFLVIAVVTIISSCVSPTSLTPTPTLTQANPTASEVEATPTNEPITIKFWEWFGGARGDFFEEEAKLFNEQYPWITVEVEHYPDQSVYREALTLAFNSGDAPDVFLRRHSVSQMISNGWIKPIDPWITPEWLARFPESSFLETRNMWKGEIYSFPTFATIFDRVLFINTKMFGEAGLVEASGGVKIPSTWSELRTVAKQVTTAGNGEFYGMGIGIKDAKLMGWWFDLANLAGAPGPDNFDYRTGRYSYGSNPVYNQLIDLLLGMKQDGSIYPYESSMDDSNYYVYFAQGKFAMFISGSWSIANLTADFPDFQDYIIAPIPYPDEGRSGGFGVTPGQSFFFMSSQTKHPDEVWLWLDWVSSPDFHTRMVAKGLGYSVYPEINNQQNITDIRMWESYEISAKYSVNMPFPPARNPETALVVPEPVVPDVGDVLVGIYTGQISNRQQALEDLDKRKQASFEAAIQKARNNGANVSIDDFIFPDWDPLQNYVTQSAK